MSWVGGVLLLALTGCKVAYVKPDSVLAPDQGVVLMSTHCGRGVNVLMVHASGTAPVQGGHVVEFACRAGLMAVPMKQGRYYVGTLFENPMVRPEAHAEPESVSFTVVPGQVTYIGEISATWHSAPMDVTGGTLYVSDRADESLQLAKRRQPWLLERHPFKVQLARAASGQPSPAEVDAFRASCPDEACREKVAPPLDMYCPTRGSCAAP